MKEGVDKVVLAIALEPYRTMVEHGQKIKTLNAIIKGNQELSEELDKEDRTNLLKAFKQYRLVETLAEEIIEYRYRRYGED